ncbi:hypothetical protein A2U01_0051598, partial [Trifolium medium]|nr:hypothetical protein [Trifolium medium]
MAKSVTMVVGTNEELKE